MSDVVANLWLPWIIVILLVLVALAVFLDSRRVERLYDFRHAELDIRELDVENREANVQKLLSDGRATIAILRNQIVEKERMVEAINGQNMNLRDRIVAMQSRTSGRS